MVIEAAVRLSPPGHAPIGDQPHEGLGGEGGRSRPAHAVPRCRAAHAEARRTTKADAGNLETVPDTDRAQSGKAISSGRRRNADHVHVSALGRRATGPRHSGRVPFSRLRVSGQCERVVHVGRADPADGRVGPCSCRLRGATLRECLTSTVRLGTSRVRRLRRAAPFRPTASTVHPGAAPRRRRARVASRCR